MGFLTSYLVGRSIWGRRGRVQADEEGPVERRSDCDACDTPNLAAHYGWKHDYDCKVAKRKKLPRHRKP